MRITLILPSLGIGGTEKMVFSLAKGLSEHGHAIQVIALKQKGFYEEPLRSTPIEVQSLGTPDGLWAGLLDLPRLCLSLRKRVQVFKPHIIHSFLTRANVLTRCIFRHSEPPTIISSLRVMEQEKRFHWFAERLSSFPSALFTVNSDALKRFAIETIGLRPSQIHVIRNGVETPRAVDELELHRLRRLYYINTQTVIFSAGRLHRQKGFDLLISAFQNVFKRNRNVLLLIAGEGEERGRLTRQIQKLNLTQTVRLLGLINDITPLFKLAHLFVLASRWEGMPNVIFESMAAGCPVLSTDVGGVREVLSAPEEGMIVEPGNPTQLENSMEEMISSPDGCKAAAQRALKKAETFTMHKMVLEHENLYRLCKDDQ